jgi:hypothetical protein
VVDAVNSDSLVVHIPAERPPCAIPPREIRFEPNGSILIQTRHSAERRTAENEKSGPTISPASERVGRSILLADLRWAARSA